MINRMKRNKLSKCYNNYLLLTIHIGITCKEEVDNTVCHNWNKT